MTTRQQYVRQNSSNNVTTDKRQQYSAIAIDFTRNRLARTCLNHFFCCSPFATRVITVYCNSVRPFCRPKLKYRTQGHREPRTVSDGETCAARVLFVAISDEAKCCLVRRAANISRFAQLIGATDTGIAIGKSRLCFYRQNLGKTWSRFARLELGFSHIHRKTRRFTTRVRRRYVGYRLRRNPMCCISVNTTNSQPYCFVCTRYIVFKKCDATASKGH